MILFVFTQTLYASTQFLTLSDIHYGSKNNSGQGQDTGDDLLQLAMTKLSQLAAKVEFIIYLGDMPTHGSYEVKEKELYEKIVFQSLYRANTLAKPMFYIPGNNDSLAGNYQPFTQNGRSPLNLAEDWSGACVHCENLIIDDQYMYEGGYYASYAIPNNHDLILIALNSTQFLNFPSRYPPYPNQRKEAQVQLQWFAKQLANHQAKQLLIAMHEPPGFDYQGQQYWETQYLEQFLTAIKKNQTHYQEITLLTSHTHMDEIRKINLDESHTLYAFSTPSISRIHNNNPAMKIFDLGNDLSLKNFVTHYTHTVETWLDEHYYAMNSSDSIFPQCNYLNLTACLNSLSQETACKAITSGLFYGVKNTLVDNSHCHNIYQVN